MRLSLIICAVAWRLQEDFLSFNFISHKNNFFLQIFLINNFYQQIHADFLLSCFIFFYIDICLIIIWRRWRWGHNVGWICEKIIVTLMHWNNENFLIFELFHHRAIAWRCKIFIRRAGSWRWSARCFWRLRSSLLTGIFRACHHDKKSKESCECCQVPKGIIYERDLSG